jgi:vanillate O-demethylase ferredoxin subunit
MGATNIEVWQSATVVATRFVAEDILRIELETTKPAKADPGSHIDVRVTIDGARDKRSYSIVESRENGRILVISVFKTPNTRGGSLYMQTLEPGDRLEITQPLQNFPLRIGAPRYLLLAGGIGVTAVLAMAAALRRVGADYRFVYAARTKAAMAYREQIQELHGDRAVIHIDDEGSFLDVDALVASTDGQTELYMCGPIRLMDAVRRAWANAGRSLPNLRYETFGNSGWYDPEEFEVEIPRLGIRARVGQGVSMLEALEDAGADMMFDCRKGECGLCEVRVLDLQGVIDHRDVFYSQRQQEAAAKMCCCVSRVVTAKTATAHSPGISSAGTPRISIDVS